MSIADTGRFWKILVIPVLQILEDSGTILVIPVLQILENTGNISIADTGRLGMKLRKPVLLDEEYWSFQYRVFYNTSITSIAG